MNTNKQKTADTDIKNWLTGMALGAVLLIGLIGAYAIGFDRGEESVGTAGTTTTEKTSGENGSEQTKPADDADAGPGKDLFVASCGGCHVLKAAGTSGAAGPNLDTIKPNADLVNAAIAKGGAGSGAMPAGLLKGEEADQVAAYVEATAGR